MSNLPKIDGILRSLREDGSGTEIARQVGDAVQARFPKGKLSFEPANEFNSFSGLRRYVVKSGHPIVIEFEFEEDTPQGPEDHQRDSYHRDFRARFDAAMEDWRDFLTNEISKVAETVKPGLEVINVETPHPDVALVTLERGSV